MYKFILAVALCAASAGVTAADLEAFQVDEVVAQQRQIRADMDAGTGRYAKLKQHEKADVAKRQDMLFQLLDGKSSSNELSHDQYAKVFAALESIEATINGSPGDSLVCRSEKVTGSNRPVRVCRTRAQMEAERDQARKSMDIRRVGG